MAFDLSEYDVGPDEDVQQTAGTVVEAVAQSVAAPVDDYDQYMNEVERRLEIASYYRLLLNDRLFNTDSPAAVAVENEMRAFAKKRLQVLLNVASEDTPATAYVSPFSDEQTEALKAVADKVLSTQNRPPKPPQIKKVEAPAPALRKPQEPPQRAVVNRPMTDRAPTRPQAQAPTAPKKLPGRPRKLSVSSPHALPTPSKAAFEAQAALAAQTAAAANVNAGGVIGSQMITAALLTKGE